MRVCAAGGEAELAGDAGAAAAGGAAGALAAGKGCEVDGSGADSGPSGCTAMPGVGCSGWANTSGGGALGAGCGAAGGGEGWTCGDIGILTIGGGPLSDTVLPQAPSSNVASPVLSHAARRRPPG
jgi:hypothetical protein